MFFTNSFSWTEYLEFWTNKMYSYCIEYLSCLCMGNCYFCECNVHAGQLCLAPRHSRLLQINGSPSFRPEWCLVAHWAGTAVHSWGCMLALIRASLMSWEVESLSIFAMELLRGKVTFLCAPGLLLTSFLWRSSDLCLQAPCTGAPLCWGFTFFASASSKRPAGSLLHPALSRSSPGRLVPQGLCKHSCGFSSSQSLYIETSYSSGFLSGNAKFYIMHETWGWIKPFSICDLINLNFLRTL